MQAGNNPGLKAESAKVRQQFSHVKHTNKNNQPDFVQERAWKNFAHAAF